MRVSVVIPCYRSEASLPTLIEGLFTVLSDESMTPEVTEFEVILVVDGSPDGTGRVAREINAIHPTVRVVELQRNYGQHNALLAGIARARYETIVTMDDDLQHLPEEIPTLMAPVLAGEADLVYGVSLVEEHGWWRSLASRVLKRALAVAGVPNAMDVSAFRAFRTALRDGFVDVTGPYVSVDVLLSWTTTAVQRAPVRMSQRVHGTSSYTVRALVRHAINMITGYSTVPLRAVAWLGLVAAGVGVALGAIVLWRFATGDTIVAGFTTIAAMVALFSGAQMLSLGVIGEYLGRVHTRSLGKPTFVVRSDTADQPGTIQTP